jgi:predicted Rossmann-fold nucleotide-binding protein
LDEFLESMTLIQTQKTERFPVILVGSAFWSPLIDWMREYQLGEHPYISEEDLEIFEITDDVKWAAQVIADHYAATLEARRGETVPVPYLTAEGTVTGREPQKPASAVGPFEDLSR